MSTIAEQQLYEKRIQFYATRLNICGYRFYDMIQTRHKEMLRLNNNYQDETTQQDVQNKVLRSADVFINCLHGEHDNRAADPVIPDFLESEANAFKTHLYTNLAPKFVLQTERFKLLSTIFQNKVKQ